MPYSYKRLVRKLFINVTVKKIANNELFQIKQDKILLIDYFVKFFVFDKELATESQFASKISVNSFFFNRKNLISRLQNIKKLIFYKTLTKFRKKNQKLTKNRKLYNKVNLQKKLKIYKKLHNLRLSNFLLSGKVQYI